MVFSFLTILIGTTPAMQATVNSRLGHYTKTPFLASAISFCLGSLFLLIALYLTGDHIGFDLSVFQNKPWWLWTAGITGAFSLTVNVLVFPKLGSIQTALLPIVGQIIMGLTIDQFGLFNAPVSQIKLIKVVGVLFVIAGMLLTVLFGSKNKRSQITTKSKYAWQFLAILSGLVFGMQIAINGQAGIAMGSPVKVTLLAFVVGSFLLIGISRLTGTPIRERLKDVKIGLKTDRWILLGGIFGACYVMLSAWLAPMLGTGQLIVLSLSGQLLFSTLIDQFGLFKAEKRPISVNKIIGLILMFIGVFLVHFA